MIQDYLETYKSLLDVEAIRQLREEAQAQLQAKKLAKFKQAIDQLPRFKTKDYRIKNGKIHVGHQDEMSCREYENFSNSVNTFIPWKKGPFHLFGIDIDSEWRSDLKWNRFHQKIASLKSKRVADIGCHNGYFMFRMAEHDPEIVIGFEPYGKNWYNFQLIQRFAQIESINFEMLGVESINLYPEFFDSVFCLGILYHHTDPVGILKKIHSSLRSGGEIYIDCQGIPGEEPMILVPEQRYAQARGVWNLPTLKTIEIWLKRTNFRKIQCLYSAPLDHLEQRKTKWAPIKSLEDFLDPNNSSKTIEGYPAPWRFYLKAMK